MADSNNPKKTKIQSSSLLPRYYRTDSNKKFLQATVDQLVQPGTVKKINGYIGRKNSKATTSNDIFIEASSKARQDYQLEPSFLVKDALGNTTFFKDYQDYINQLSVFGANTRNHARLNAQEFYSWDPHIEWDKFVNFQNYYWLPYGPDIIKISGQQENIVSTYKIDIRAESDNNVYIFSPDGSTPNPTIKLYRGRTYRFEISSSGNPFSIKTKRIAGVSDRYSSVELTNNAVEIGVIEFHVPFNSPDVLYYVSETDVDLGGVFQILSIEDNTTFNVDTELLGKKSYQLPNGVPLSNGMKVSFVGEVLPEIYRSGQYYVEGVGSSIRLVSESTLELISPYTETEAILFESTPFDSQPFSDATSFAGRQDYIVINRGAIDRNPWSRYNRWFHKDVIETSARINNKVASIDQDARAKRPIIEFEPNIKLYNFGVTAIEDVDLVDTFTIDVFSNVEGQLGYNVDGINLAQGQRVLFTADRDILVKNKIYRVEFLTLNGVRQIHLVEEPTPTKDQVVLVKQGRVNQGSMYWFDGTVWKVAQQKLELNQAPLFDLVDNNKISFGDNNVYDGSTFTGTKLFSYKVRNTPSDQVGDKPFSLKVGSDTTLGFPLTFRNIENIGDIVFAFDIATGNFQYKKDSNIITVNTNTGFLLKTTGANTEYVNGWQLADTTNYQAAVRIYKNSNLVNNFAVDVYDNIRELDDLELKIYINGIFLNRDQWALSTGLDYKQVVLNKNISLTDVLTIKSYSSQPINSNGFYEIPLNLQNNPLNNELQDFTLGEVIDHVSSIVENLSNFEGSFPGVNNLRDLGNISKFGRKFVQHSGPSSLSLYHITSDNNNVIRALEFARDEYNRFKRNFIAVADSLGVDTDPVRQVNLILQEINKDKPKTAPYYFSDMVPYTGSVKTELSVLDSRIKTYPLSAVFSLDELSVKSVLVYLNDTQLLHGKDYTFDQQGFVVVTAQISVNDKIVIYEFDNTNGCFIPPTPTKLGLYPRYEPKIYLDTSLATPRTMIQGHDGSQVLAYGDYRDQLILEIEKRIYNNIKITYDPTIFNVDEMLPAYNRTTDYSLNEFNEVLASNFYSWTAGVDRDFTKPLNYSRDDSLTFNYKELATPDGRTPLPGYWKGVYRWMLGTDRPNLCPWEMLGFSEEPAWWQALYGPAPYTKDNIILWSDIADGLIREPGKPAVQSKKYIRSYLKNIQPVDEDGNIVSPLLAGFASGIITTSTASDFVFGDVSPVESAWRRSSYYPFSLLLTSMLLQPAKTFGLLLDRSRIVRNLAGQLVYKDTNIRIRTADVVLPSIYSSSETVLTSGIVNYLVDYILSDNLKSYNEYKYNLEYIETRLSHRIGSFTSKEKFNLLLDSKTPLSSGSVFIPQEDYDIILNASSPTKRITYSGVIITKLFDGYVIKGYSKSQPYFKYYPFVKNGVAINVGGISESFVEWTPNVQYAPGKVVSFGNRYYRVRVLHTTSSTFDLNFYELLAALPMIGGKEAFIRTEWDRSEVITVPYGIKFRTIQEVVDFLLGYGEWLKDQGFIFDEFNSELNAVTNWETSAKEFLFWTTQNWSTGEDKWDDWLPDQEVNIGSIVRYDGEYYRALRTSPPAGTFDDNDYIKLDGLSLIGSSVISLSPAAAKLTFKAPLSVVDDIRNPFNSYEIFKVNGTPIQPNFLNSFRDDNAVSYTPIEDAIYGATFYLIQKEQVVVLKNTTLFNDTIYNPESGYRQERIKVSGYISADWNGSFNIPGFIFDQANVSDWEPWKDYALGDIVRQKQFYYTAESFTAGTDSFDTTKWIKLDKKPTAQLLPNWNYKAEQFTDFYSLDSDNFDASQQAVAQHLVGYQKRQYLSNIIKDDVSEFKFYQGMIIEKGTQNVLNKLFDVLSANDKESVSFYEEWALRVGQYGASSAFDAIEFVIDEAETKNNPQGFELVNQIDTSKVDFISRQTPNDVYLKPIGYNNNPWPVSTKDYNFLRTPGYVRPNDVKYIFKEFDQILTSDIASYIDGDCVWIGFEGREWNVYRYTRLTATVLDVTYSVNNKTLSVKLEKNPKLNVGSIVGIDQVSFSGLYKISAVSLDTIVLNADITNFRIPFTEGNQIVLSTFRSNRIVNNGTDVAIDIADSIFDAPPPPGEIIWTDDNGSGKWATWQYNPVYEVNEFINTSPAEGLQYGKQIAINQLGNLSAVTNSLGEAIIYDKASPFAPWLQRQTITAPFVSKTGSFNINPTPTSLHGDVIAISSDNNWMATGVPRASQVSSNCRFVNNSTAWSSTTAYIIGNIVTLHSIAYRAKVTANNTNKLPSTETAFWEELPYIPVSDQTSATNSPLNEQGVVSIYRKDNNNIFSLVATVISPTPMSGEQFGSSVIFGKDTLFVGAASSNNGAGKVYKFNYLTLVRASTSHNPIGSNGTTLVVTNTSGITEGMFIQGTGFSSRQFVAQVTSSTTLILSAPPDSQISGILEFTVTDWRFKATLNTDNALDPGAKFGSNLAISKDNSTLLVSAPGTTLPGKVYIYKTQDYITYSVSETINGTEVKFGTGLAVSDAGDYIAISCILSDGEKIDQGRVSVYKQLTNGYEHYQDLRNLDPETAEFFGSKISFMNDSQTIVVYSKASDVSVSTTFDGTTTTLDNNLTKMIDILEDSGRIDIYDRYNSKWIFSESLVNNLTVLDGYSAGLAVGNNIVLVGAPFTLNQGFESGKVFEYRKSVGARSWTVKHTESDRVDLFKIKRAFLYNKETNKMVSYLDVIDPVQGKIPGIADQEIKYKTFYDPAVYYSGNSSVNVDEGMSWSKNQVGTLWWDLRTAKFYDSQDQDLVYRNSTWNTLFPGASIDVYEWVESTSTPAKWNELADTDVGLAQGISGTTLYGNEVYGLVRRYDTVGKTFKNTYYFWVKNKKTTPANPNRRMSASSVAELIGNPRGYGYKYLALTGKNSFSLSNVKSLLDDKNIVLSVEYWTGPYTDQRPHSEWKIISNNPSTTIPNTIEKKWFDSLSGKDDDGRLVPDTSLPPKLKYGVEVRPRQSMFVNRFEALKQLIEQVNRTLRANLVVENADISNLDSFEKEPTTITGLYDDVIDTGAELRFANIGTYEKPMLQAVIEDGRIIGVDIVQKGRGYLVAPYFDIAGSGIGAKIRAVINRRGQITGVDIVSSGEGYTDESTTITVRNYSVLVRSDEDSYGSWSIYAYEPTTQKWSRIRSQSYDVRRYWSYIDWYAVGYNEFTAVDFSVNSFVELNTLESNINQLVKVRVTSLGTWLLLRKYANSSSVDWTQSYEVIGREKGTLQFSSNLYSFSNTQFGFDGSLYDSSVFDNAASAELKIILNTLKDKILIDDLRQVYLDLFFNSVRYALSEQNYVDWIFKTSFVKATHNVGELTQKVTYNNDSLENFEDFINEVKPYRTKVREYVSSYLKVDNSAVSSTDFDLPAVFEDNKISPIIVNLVDGLIQSSSNKVTQYPWKYWLDNLGFAVTAVEISDGGSGYVSAPNIRFSSNTGTGATARAFITNGRVNRIVLLNKGTGYLSAPTVIIEGGTRSDGVSAKAVAIIGDSVVRSNLIKIKFDRISQKYLVTKMQETETFSGTAVSGSRLQFALTWAPDIRVGQSTVLINGVEALRSNYTLKIVKNTTRGYTKYSGSITFDVAPPRESVISITYIKDWSLLSAADRIQYYYDPATGELGKDLAQLMTGVDYGGVVVTGLEFDIGQGWGVSPYYTDKWDSFDANFDDYIVTVSANTHDFTLPYVPADGTELNVYYSSKNVETYVGDGFTKIYNFNVYNIYPPVVTVSTTVEFDYTNPSVNIIGSDIIKVASVTGIKIGDVLAIDPLVEKTLGFEPKVVLINSTTREIKIDQILFKDIAIDTSAVFTRTLVDPVDCSINPNGTVFLNEEIPATSSILITGLLDPIRLDDPEFTPERSVALLELETAQLELTVLISDYKTLLDSKASLESTINDLETQLTSLQTQVAALLVVLDGLDPSDPLYNPTVSQLNILTNTQIPAVEVQLQQAENDLETVEDGIIDNQIDKVTKQQEIDQAQTAFDAFPTLQNSNAIMQTVVSDGVPDSPFGSPSKTFSIPTSFNVIDGDKFIWRKSTSDGSLAPQDSDYDTALSGGNLAYSTATGLAADDIIVDGDGFVTATTSPATEEVVPGQIVDAVAIKVYDKPNTGSATIKVDSYIADGVTTEFLISQQPNSPTAVIVKLTDGSRDPVTNELVSISTVKLINQDYELDFRNRLITFEQAPTDGTLVSIFSFGFNGVNILDLDYFIADGTQTEFVTRAPWRQPVNYLVYVDGLPAQPGTPALFETDYSYDSSGRIGLNFSIPPTAGSLINYIIVDGPEQNYSITNSQRFQGNNTALYNLDYPVGDSLPLESNMIVRVDQNILAGPNNSYYTVETGKLDYTIDPAKFLPYTLSTNDIVVLADGELLRTGIDYLIELQGITIKINNAVNTRYLGKELVISVRRDLGYLYVPATNTTSAKIQLVNVVSPQSIVEVISSYKHDILSIQRTEVKITNNLPLTPDTTEFYNYKGLSAGVIQLDRSVIDDNYVWVIKNGSLLSPSADFKLNNDRRSISLALYPALDDSFTVITFSNNVISGGVSYMQFKDMLNRFHFKRLNANKRTVLVNSLRYTDTVIEVEDASNFDIPNIANNKPGIIEIRGERIEYFNISTKQENGVTTYLLGQLRRGTLGTGVSILHRAGSYVQEIGVSETIPYTETTTVDQITSDGTNIVPLTFIPAQTTTEWEYSQGFVSSIPQNFGQSNEIEVFVGGYDIAPWVSGVSYTAGAVVDFGSYTYRCVSNHTSSDSFNTDAANWTFFVGNIRLKKAPYKVHNINNHPDSPEGDVQLDADFAVDGISNSLRLTTNLKFGTRVTVIKKTGVDWDSTVNVINSDNKISRFLKAAPGVWYATVGKYDSTVDKPSTFDSIAGTFDSTLNRFDQG
jgi:hypothetical protein